MSLRLSEVLRHPSLAPAHPVWLAGTDPDNDRTVRWVHSSEVLEIAPLLRGGELLLTGGHGLVEAGPHRQRRYIRELAQRGVTAVAVETGEDHQLPASLIDEAHRRGFALIALARTVPFVEVTEHINGLLINDSLNHLRLADSVSEELSTHLTDGGDLQSLTTAIAARTQAHAAVRDTSGEILAMAAEEEFPADTSTTREAPVTVHGIVTATLHLAAGPKSDPSVLEAALDRAPQSLGLALLRAQPPSTSSRAARALFRALRHPESAPQDLRTLLDAAELTAEETFVAVAGHHTSMTHLGAAENAMRHRGRQVLSHIEDGELLALIALPADEAVQGRKTLVEDLRQAVGGDADSAVLAVGPPARNPETIGHTVDEARRCLQPQLARYAHSGVVDARTCSLDRLVHRLGADTPLRAFVEEQLGEVLAQPPATRDRLLHTLEAFFESAGSRTETARRLHLRRQTLYQRLSKLTEVVGHDITEPEVFARLHIAIGIHRSLQHD